MNFCYDYHKSIQIFLENSYLCTAWGHICWLSCTIRNLGFMRWRQSWMQALVLPRVHRLCVLWWVVLLGSSLEAVSPRVWEPEKMNNSSEHTQKGFCGGKSGKLMCGGFVSLVLALRVRLQEKGWWPGHTLGELLPRAAPT